MVLSSGRVLPRRAGEGTGWLPRAQACACFHHSLSSPGRVSGISHQRPRPAHPPLALSRASGENPRTLCFQQAQTRPGGAMRSRQRQPDHIALALLRTVAGWTKKEQAQALGIYPNRLTESEAGGRDVSRAELEWMVACMGFTPA